MRETIDRFLIAPTLSLKDAMKRLEETERRVLFVVESDGKLVGSLTDGDIRRWILAEGTLAAAVSEVCFREPFTVGTTFDLESVRRVMRERQLNCEPALDEQGRVRDLHFWSTLFDEIESPGARRIDLPVVIMAGGRGTRLEPFTRILPKPLVPIGDRAVIEIIIESFLRHGIGVFYLSVNHKARIIKSFFEELQPPYTVNYLEESEPRGTAGGLLALRDQVSGPIIVTNCDVVARMDYADLVDHHVRERNLITLVASVKPLRIPYGVCELANGGQLANIQEKPEFQFLVNTGLYVIDASVIELIPQTGMFHTTDLIESVKARGGRVGVFPIGGDAWLDTGEWTEYRKTIDLLRTERRSR